MSLVTGSTRMLVGVPREGPAGESRVALVPSVVPQLVRAGLDVIVERGAGDAAGFPDDAYAAHGATGERSDPQRIGDDAAIHISGCRA